jgi:hypothetical protein
VAAWLGGKEFTIPAGAGRKDILAMAEQLGQVLRAVRPGFFLPGGYLAASFATTTRQPGESLGSPLLHTGGALYNARMPGETQGARLSRKSEPLPLGVMRPGG